MRVCQTCRALCETTHRFCPTCGADLKPVADELNTDGSIGAVIGSKFVLQELIGSGGMGKVYRAEQLGVGRSVAVKIMHNHLLGDATASARFQIEVRAASQLNHPHSIAVVDFGQTENGLHYLVMEFLRGRPLDKVIQQDFPIPFGRLAHTLCQAMEAVEAAHRLQIIHRDLKPENIFLLDTRSGQDFVKVLDFGIAKVADNEDRSVTTPGMVPGTPEYMSPEQARGEVLDPRSDVYALGVIFYEMLTGTVPFRGRSAVATMMAHVQTSPEPPSKRRPERQIPTALDAIALWALAKRPADRIGSARQFRDVLAAWADVTGVWPADVVATSSPEVLFEVLSPAEVQDLQAHSSAHQVAEAAPFAIPATKPQLAQQTGALWGRSDTLSELNAFLNQPDTAARAMAFRGAAGIGKRRLMDALVQEAKSKSFTAIRCDLDHSLSKQTLGPVRSIARFCLGLSQHADTEAEDLLHAALAAETSPANIAGLKELFAIPGHLSRLDPQSRRVERLAAFRALLCYRASLAPLLLICEAYDQYDESSKEMLESIVTDLPDRVWFVFTYSQDFSANWTSSGMGHVAETQLRPLDPDATRQLLASVLGDRLPDTEKLDAYVQLTQGIPLFAEHVACAYMCEGIEHPPDSMADLIATRLQRVSQQDREILQVLAVLDQPSTLAMVRKMLPHQVITEAQLQDLVERYFVKKVIKTQFIVSHPLVAKVIYSSIPAEVRRALHQAVAQWLRDRNESVSLISHHAFFADEGPRAIDELEQAGAVAEQALDYKTAIQYYFRALELARREWGRARLTPKQLDQLAVDLSRRLATALRVVGDLAAADGVLEETLSVSAGQDEARARLRLELARVDIARGLHARAMRRLELARRDAEMSGGQHWLEGEILRCLARCRGMNGDVDAAALLLAAGIEAGQRASRSGEANWTTLLEAADIALQISLPYRARGYLFEALQQTELDRSLHGKIYVLMKLAELHRRDAEWGEYERRLTQALELAEQTGDRLRQADLLCALGSLYRSQADTARADKTLMLANQLYRDINWAVGHDQVQLERARLRSLTPIIAA